MLVELTACIDFLRVLTIKDSFRFVAMLDNGVARLEILSNCDNAPPMPLCWSTFGTGDTIPPSELDFELTGVKDSIRHLEYR